jgi:hypothetical protein
MTTLITNFFNTINNSKFLTSLVFTVMVILLLCLLTYIINLLGNIRAYINNKSNSYYLANLKNTRKDNSTLAMPDRMQLTNDVLDLIAFMINNEIMNEMKPYIILNNQYIISNIDKDVEIISKRVFNGINESLFLDPDLVLKTDYLSAFITKKTLTTMLDVATQHNISLRTPQSTGD